MLQEIIVYIILFISFGITIYKMLGFLNIFKENRNKSACGSCAAGSCGSCSMKSYQHLPNSIQNLKIDTEDLKPITK